MRARNCTWTAIGAVNARSLWSLLPQGSHQAGASWHPDTKLQEMEDRGSLSLDGSDPGWQRSEGVKYRKPRMMKPSGDPRTDSVEGRCGSGTLRPCYSREQESQLQDYYGLFPKAKILIT